MDVDFLSLLEDEDTSDGQPDQASALAAADGSARHAEAHVACAALVPAQPVFRARAKFPSMRGRVGKGRHGASAERSLLACHMRRSAFMSSLPLCVIIPLLTIRSGQKPCTDTN